jgi:hypothetical protein
MPSRISSRRVVVVSFLVDVLDVVTNLAVAVLTGNLAEDLDTTQIEAVLDDVEVRVRATIPETGRVRVLLNSPETAAATEQDSSARSDRRAE